MIDEIDSLTRGKIENASSYSELMHEYKDACKTALGQPYDNGPPYGEYQPNNLKKDVSGGIVGLFLGPPESPYIKHYEDDIYFKDEIRLDVLEDAAKIHGFTLVQNEYHTWIFDFNDPYEMNCDPAIVINFGEEYRASLWRYGWADEEHFAIIDTYLALLDNSKVENATTYTEMVTLFEESGLPFFNYEPTRLGGKLEGGINKVSFTPTSKGHDYLSFNNYVNEDALTYAVEKNGFKLWKEKKGEMTAYTVFNGSEEENVFLKIGSDSEDDDVALLNRNEITCAIIDDYIKNVKDLS